MGTPTVEPIHIEVPADCGRVRPGPRFFYSTCIEGEPTHLRRLRIGRERATWSEPTRIRGLPTDEEIFLSHGHTQHGLIYTTRTDMYDFSGQVWRVSHRGRARLLRILPDHAWGLAVSDHGQCMAWRVRDPESQRNLVYFASGPGDGGKMILDDSRFNVHVTGVDCGTELLWTQGFHDGQFRAISAVTGDVLDEIQSAQPNEWGVSEVESRGVCSAGVFGPDLLLQCHANTLGMVPLPTSLGKPYVRLTEGMEHGGFVAFTSIAQRHVSLLEVSGDGPSDWLDVAVGVPPQDLLYLAGVEADRRHVCVEWMRAEDGVGPVGPIQMECFRKKSLHFP